MSSNRKVTNSDVLQAVLLPITMCGGRSECDTTSELEIFCGAERTLCEEREVAFDSGFAPTSEGLQQSVHYFIARLRELGLLKEWKGTIRRYIEDPNRLYSPSSIEKHLLRRRFEELVQAQTDRSLEETELPSILVLRSWVEQAGVAEGEELTLVTYRVDRGLQDYAPDTEFMPRQPNISLSHAYYQFLKAILLTREGKVEEATELILRSQIVSVQARALWLAQAIRKLVAGDGATFLEILCRKSDIAAQIFLEESRRQITLESAILEFNEETGGVLSQFVDFDWLNSPFSIWG